ncbi:MAG: sortase [Patescibacteria group bacterium]
MSKYYYKKTSGNLLKKSFRIASATLLIVGLLIAVYIFSPLILWQIYFQRVFASQNMTMPIPKSIVVNSSIIENLIIQAKNTLTGVDYTNAENWFPTFSVSKLGRKGSLKVSSYTLSIPKIQIDNAHVSAVDNNVGAHLVNYQGTSIPGDLGNAVIFGHSTLPQLFNPKDYKTIFANAYKLKIGDRILTHVNGVSYLYKIYSISVVDPSDTSVFSQTFDNSYVTLVTCTPPGTVWKRLVVKASLEKI